MAWTYSDYVTYDEGPTRLERLRLHVKEVADALQTGSYSIPGMSMSRGELVNYMSTIQREEKELANSPKVAPTTRSRFIRGFPRR